MYYVLGMMQDWGQLENVFLSTKGIANSELFPNVVVLTKNVAEIINPFTF